MSGSLPANQAPGPQSSVISHHRTQFVYVRTALNLYVLSQDIPVSWHSKFYPMDQKLVSLNMPSHTHTLNLMLFYGDTGCMCGPDAWNATTNRV